VIPLVGEDNRMPLVHSLSFNASGRWDSYSDFGTTNNYKLGISYQPFEDLTIRGTKGSSYAAPSLADTSAPDTRFTYTPQRVTPNAIVPVGTSAADALRPSISSPGGNPLLGPELGQTWSIGGDFRPGEYLGVDFTGLELSVTAWSVTFSNQIGLTPFNNTNLTLFSGAYDQYYIINPTLADIQARYATNGVAVIGFPGSDLASAFNQPGQNNPFIYYDLRRNNLGKARLKGIDFAIRYVTDIMDVGTIGFGIEGTVNTQNVTQASPILPEVNIVKYGVPLSATTAYLQFSTGPVSSRVWVQYSPGFALAPTSQSTVLYGQRRAEAFHPVNAFISYNLTNVFDWTEGASINLTVNNIGDENPPILLAGGTSSPVNFGTGIVANGGTLGRYFVVGLQKTF
jgi:iron complex outermembrane recepter protein